MKRFHIKTSRSNLQSLNHYNLKNVRINEDNLEFTTDEKSFEKMKHEIEIESTDLTTSYLVRLFKKHLITIIGCMIIIVALVNQSISVVDIKFTNPDTYDPEVVEYLEKHFKRIGPFRYLSSTLTEVNFDLRSNFYHYEWIGLSKKGSMLYIDIKKIINPPVEVDNRPGSYYAKYDGIVKRYHIEKGIVVVQEEQFVAKGDLLISGQIIHYGNNIEHIRAKGYVIAEVLQYKDYTIPKKTSAIIRSGRIEIIKDYYIFKLRINKNPSEFEKFACDEGSLFNIFDIFRSKKIYRYEIKEVVTTYNIEQAEDYARSLVYKEFRSQKVNDFEKVVFNNLVKIEEDENYFYVRLIVKSYQNIAEFYLDEISP